MSEIRTLIRDTLTSWSDVHTPRLSAALAYYTVLSLAPLLVVAIGIAGLVFGKEAARGQILWQIRDTVGDQGAAFIQSVLQHAGKPSSGITATFIGMIVLLFGASAVFGELRDSLDTLWGVKPPDAGGIVGLMRQRFFSFAMVLAIGFLLLVSLAVSAFLSGVGKFFEGYLPMPEAVLHLITLFISFVGITLLFALLYKFVPDTTIGWRDVWIGAAVTSLLFSIGKSLIGLYLGKASVGSAYGAAGSLVVTLVWVYYSAQIFLLGAEFTRIFAMRWGSLSGSTANQEPRAAGLSEPYPAQS